MTPGEIKQIALEMYPSCSMEDIVKATGLRIAQIKGYACNAGIKRNKTIPSYLNHSDEILSLYRHVPNSIIQDKYNITYGQLTQLAYRNNVKKVDVYNDKVKFIKKNYQLMSNAEIANRLGITAEKVAQLAYKIELKKEKKFIKEPEYYKFIDEILAAYPTVNTLELSEKYNMTTSQIQLLACRRGVKKQVVFKKKQSDLTIQKKTRTLMKLEPDIIKEDKPSELESAGFFDADKFFKLF